MNKQATPVDFSAVYTTHAPFVRRILTRRGIHAADLDDALQEVFVIVHRQLPGFEGRARIETWLHSVAWRVSANYHRRKRTEASLSSEWGRIAPTDEPQMTARPGARLRTLLNDIDERQRDLLALHEIGGLSISELSNITGNARVTVRNALERARLAVGRHIRAAAISSSDDEAWVARFAPRFEAEPATLPLAEPIVFERNAFACIGDTVIVVWRGHGSVASMEVLLPILFAVAEVSPTGLRYLSVIEPGSTPPNREGRDMTAWGLARLGPAIRAAAWVAESSHLISVVAPFMNTAFFLAGTPVNARYFDELAPASRWLAEHGQRDAPAIAACVELMRRQLTVAGIHCP